MKKSYPGDALPDVLENKRGVLVMTHPRSGTHLTIDLLRRSFPDLASSKRIFAALDSLYVAVDVFFLESASGNDVSRARAGLKKRFF